MSLQSKISCFFILFLAACSNPVPRNPVVRITTTFFNESVIRNKLLYQEENNSITDYIKRDSLNSYHLSDDGFWYSIIKQGTLNKSFPKKGDIVTYTYEVKNLNNEIIYNKNIVGIKKYIIDKENIILGLQKGIKLMHIGDVGQFIFPSYLAFGYHGDGNKIGSNEILIYTIQLKRIITKNDK